MLFLDIRKGYGGAEKYFDTICEDLRKEKIEFNTLVIDKKDFNFMQIVKSLVAIKNERIIYNNSVLGIDFIFIFILKILGNEIILYSHIVQSHKLLGSKFYLIRNITRYLSLKIANKVIAISDGNYSILSQFIPKERVFRLYNYIRLEISNEKRKIGNNIKSFAVIGRLQNRHKQQMDTLIDLADFILEKNIEIHFFGDGPDREQIEKLINDKKLNQNVYLHGWIDTEKIFKYDFSVVLSFAKWEGLPLNILEAISFNKIIIGRNVDGVNELLYGDFLFNDVNQLKLIINEFLNNTSYYNELFTFNKKYVFSKYNYNNFVANFKELIK